MAAATVTGLAHTFTSNKRVVLATLALAATGDTWDSGLANAEGIQLTSKTANVPGLYYTVSGGTFTFVYTGGGAAALSALTYGT